MAKKIIKIAINGLQDSNENISIGKNGLYVAFKTDRYSKRLISADD